MMNLHQGAVDAADRCGPRLRRSCEMCRNCKGRCIPSEGDARRCQRCVRDQKECVFLEAKPRPKRARNSRIRVAEMEEKLDGLMALLSSKNLDKVLSEPLSQTPPYPSPDSNDVTPLPMNDDELYSPAMVIPNSISSSKPQNLPIFPLCPSLDRLHDAISKGIINFQQAEECVQRFKSKATPFPFVVIPPHMSLDTLRREKPFLLLAALACSADAHAELQTRLELELRETLSRKVIVNGETSIDLLQGVLVYLTWYHFYFDPTKQQIYQLCQMASAMAVDLELHKGVTQAYSRSALSIVPSLAFFPKLSEKNLEARRTYVGCYYITASLCQHLRKPNSLKPNKYLEECAESLAASSYYSTDYLMPYFLRLQQLADDINSVFDYDDTSQFASLDGVRAEILIKTFQSRLRCIETTFPPEAWSNLLLKMAFYRLRIYINEVGFHAAPPSDADKVSGQSYLQSWYCSSERGNSLAACLAASKEYLDQALSSTDSEFVDFTIIEFVQLIYAILILGSFATNSNDEMVDSNHMRKSANFESYLDRLSNKLCEAALTTKAPKGNPYLSYVYDFLQQSKVWYNQVILDPATAGWSASGRPQHTFMTILDTIISRCVDFSANGNGVKGCFLDQIWGEMISKTPLDAEFVATNISSQ